MYIRIRYRDKDIDKVVEPSLYYSVILPELKRLGYRQENGLWVGDRVSKTLLKYFPMKGVGFYYKSYYVFFGDEPKHLSYVTKKYRKAECYEYCEKFCEDRCEYDCEACEEACTDKCESENWNPVIQEEVEVKLYWADEESGAWKIPRGLAPRVGAKESFMWSKIEPTSYENGEVKLREYQVEVGRAVFESLYKYGGAIVQIATGGGKSFMAGWLARELNRAGYKVMVISLSVDLVNQLREFSKMWGANVYGITVQSLWRKLNIEEEVEDDELNEVLKAYDSGDLDLDINIFDRKTAVIIDEVHHVPARTVKEVVKRIGDGWALRIGLSATPWRNDGRDLEIYGWVGPVVEPRISSSYLIERGYAVPVDIHVVEPPTCDTDGTYASVRRSLAKCEERNEYIVELLKDMPKPTLVLTSLVEHAKLLYKLIDGRKALATGAVSGDERQRIFKNIKDGNIDILVATNIANEGLDLPPLRSMINTLGGKSKTLTLQRVGRLVRPWKDKDRAIVYDLCDDAKFFKNHCSERIKLYKTEPKWRIKYT